MAFINPDQLRGLMLGLSQGGAEPVPNASLFAALGLQDEPSKARLRRQLNDMVKRKEIARISDGVYRYDPAYLDDRSPRYVKIWRACRSAKPGFTMRDAALVAHVEYTSALKYMKWLESAGYLARHGRRGQAVGWRLTGAGKEHRETPYPPRPLTDPWRAERDAACRIVRVFMEADPWSRADKLLADCRLIITRLEAGGETTGEECDEEELS